MIPKDHRGLVVVQTIFNDHQSKLIKEVKDEKKMMEEGKYITVSEV